MMKYFNYFLIGVFALAAFYILFGIGYFTHLYYKVEHPKEDFLIVDAPKNDVTLVNFYAYQCDYCKKIDTTINETISLQNNIRQVLRPIQILQDEYAADAGMTFIPEKIVIAAGLQGKFTEFHEAFMEHPMGIISEEFVEETANLYGLDYEQLLKDSQGDKVQKILNDNMQTMISMGIQTIPSFVVDKNIYVVKETLPTLQNFLEILNIENK